MSMATLIFKVGGMSCMGCVGSVRRVLEQIPGVQAVAVDLAGAKAQVDYDPAQVQPEALRQAVTDAGYPVSD